MDHHLLLSNAAVTATRGAAEGVVMEEYYGEDDGEDVKGHSDDEDFSMVPITPISPTSKCNCGQQEVEVRPTSAQSYF